MRNFKLEEADVNIICAIYIVIGLLLSFFNVDIILLGSRVMGVILVLVGAYFIYCFFGKRRSTSAAPFFIGVPSFLMGLFMALHPDRFISFVPIIIGLLIIITSILQIQRAFVMKDIGLTSWKFALIIDFVALLFGISLFLKPIQSLGYILKIIGIIMIADGLYTYISHKLLTKRINES